MHVVLALVDREPLDWGLDPSRIRGPVTLLGADSIARILPGRAGEPLSIADRVRLLARCAESGPDDELWVWVEAMYAASLLSLEVLYSERLAERIRADRREWPLIYGHHGFARNPVIMALTGCELAAVAGADDQTLAEMFDPYPPMPAMERVMPVDVAHLANRATVHFARGDREPVVHVIGDSHSLFCFTPPEMIGSRDDILVAVRDLTPAPVPYRWQFTHHRGPLTMYRIGRDAGELGPGAMAEIDVRDGDAMVFVFGEIDVRCHVMKQHHLQGRTVDDIVERLVAGYLHRLGEVAARYPRSTIAVFGVIPPFDPPNYGPANPPIVGTAAERVVAARLLNAALKREAAARGFIYFDVMRQLAGPDGTLPRERSDSFCHVSYHWAHVSRAALYERLAEEIADPVLHHMGRTGLRPYVVSIGAMDGVSFDDFAGYIHLYEWSGLFVEPIPEQFRRLRAHYGELPFAAANAYENCAIAEHDGTVEMLTIAQHAVDEGAVHPCFAGMSAIYPPRNGLASAGDAAVVAAYGERIDVPCLRLQTVFDRHGVERVDLLSIDAEGWDYRILRQLDFRRYRPRLIRCEFINLAAEEQDAIRDLLADNGYVVRIAGQNIDAVAGEYWREVAASR